MEMKNSSPRRGHHQDGSLSSNQSDIDAIMEDHSISEHLEVAILASSSPEIKALNMSFTNHSTGSFAQCKRHSYHNDKSFHHHHRRQNSDGSGTNNITTNLSASIFDGIEEEKIQEGKVDLSPATSTAKVVTEVPCMQVMDLDDDKENIPPSLKISKDFADSNNSSNDIRRPPPLSLKRRAFSDRTNFSNTRGTFNSCSAHQQQQWPPKPASFRTDAATSLGSETPPKRCSLHRRVSYDSLPTLSEITGSKRVPSLQAYPSGPCSSQSSSSLLPYNGKPRHRRSKKLLIAPKSMNLSTGFR